VTRDEIWPTFDGWCASQNIEPLELPADRWLNLIYFFATRNMDEEKKSEFDGHIAEATARWNAVKVREVIARGLDGAQSGVDATGGSSTESMVPGSRRTRRLPPKPAWYGSSDNATLNNMAAMKTMTSRDGRTRTRR
jgi:hypothetical protein